MTGTCADRNRALGGDGVPAVQHISKGVRLRHATRTVRVAAPEAGAPHGVGASHNGRHFQSGSQGAPAAHCDAEGAGQHMESDP